MAYHITDPRAGNQPIANTETTQLHPLGARAKAVDPTYGEGEFIYLLGVASTIVGSLVRWNATTYQTTLADGAAAQRKATPVAVAMSANVASQYGWYQTSGLAVIKKDAVTFPANAPIFMGTSGRIKVLQSGGRQVLGATTANLATVTSTTSTVVVAIDRPSMQAQVI